MVRVLVVDDSEVLRCTIRRELEKDPGIEVVGEAGDPFAARDLVLSLKPDVITLDIQMPRMDGISFLERLMKYRPVPVVIVSALAGTGSSYAIRAMEVGAVEVLVKPGMANAFTAFSKELRHKVLAAAQVRFINLAASPSAPEPRKPRSGAIESRVVCVGASTGGVQAIEALLRGFSQQCPPTIIVQHMPAGFTASFAQRLNGMLPIEVREAADGDLISDGTALVAPGNRHAVVRVGPRGPYVEITDGPPVNNHRPSVDVLFRSAAEALGRSAIGVILTGMGADGAEGLRRMKESGSFTIAQDEATSAVYGMPRAAVERGAASVSAPLPLISSLILNGPAKCESDAP